MRTPPVSGDHQPEMSLVIPAYNERRRLPGFLDSVREYLSDEFNGDYETIVVDDGSTDGTAGWLSELQECWPQLIVLKHPQNQGKGAAVRTGVLAASVARILFSACRENGYLFDLHILCAASRLRLPIAEIPVAWCEVAGSKMRLVRDSCQMLWGLFGVRRSVKEMLLRVALSRPERAAVSALPDAGTRAHIAKALTDS